MIEILQFSIRRYLRATFGHFSDKFLIISFSSTPISNPLVRFQIFKGDAQIPKWLSSGARNMIRRILDPNPDTRITIAGIEDDEWFKQDYTPAVADDEEEDLYIDDEAFSMDEVV